MRTAGRTLWVTLVIGITFVGARAQAQDPLAAVKSDLRRLVSAEEVYHAKNKSYASDVSALPGFKPSAGVTVSIATATATGWAASGTSGTASGKSCVLFVGTVTAPKTQAQGLTGPEAVPVCDK
jgi:hypothetical protein